MSFDSTGAVVSLTTPLASLSAATRWKSLAREIPFNARTETVAFGIQGGGDAPPNQLFLHKGSEVINVDAESFYDYDTNDVFEIYESGGGGYGDAKNRPVEKVRDDVMNGIVSVENAKEAYSVVINEVTWEVDIAATEALRG